jgi:predicted nucleic acid-binding protein
MIKPVYFDSTVFVKIFKLEQGSDFAKLIIELSRRTEDFYQISMSDWTINEAISAIDQSVKTREMSKEQSDSAIGLLLNKLIEYTQPPYHIEFIEVSKNLVESSRRLINEYKISADDALHFYTAYSNNCEFFITADKEKDSISRTSS